MKHIGKILFLFLISLSLVSFGNILNRNTLSKTLKINDLKRRYFLHVPSNFPKNKSLALVLMFHGGSGNPIFAEKDTKFSDLSDREGFLVAYPEGYGKSWNDGRNEKAIKSQDKNIDDVSFINAIIDDISQDYPVDSKRIFATGISNGAIFSHFLALNLSSRIAGIAPVAGGIPLNLSENFKSQKPVSALIINGVNDPIVPYSGGNITLPWGAKHSGVISAPDTVKKWVANNACNKESLETILPDKDPKDGTRIKTFSYSGCKDNTEVLFYSIIGGGHTWPSGIQYYPKKLVGNVSRDINATEVIWDFFKKHPKP